MIAELEQAKNLFVNESRLVRRHVLTALAISFVHTVICLFYFIGGYFNAPIINFTALFAAIWLGNILIYALVTSGKTLRWRDPSLSVLITLWLTSGFLVSSYFVDVFRISVVMLFFGATLLASFRCGFWKIAFLSVFACVGYALVLVLAFRDRSMSLSLSVEGLQWLIFSLSCAGFSVTGTGIHKLRRRLSNKNEELSYALEQVRNMAIRDELTGLFNRRHILDILQQQKAIAETGDYTFSVCYLDLDHFKQINDTYGHGAGDKVLTRFGAVLDEALRDADYTGRFGGEEFILVLSNTDLQEAERVCERLRKDVEITSYSDLNAALSVTVSIGIAEYEQDEPIEDLLSRADACLYLAKNSGRNRVVVSVEGEKKSNCVTRVFA
jgi:diguanylate cyclase (GGDEF)-like protein